MTMQEFQTVYTLGKYYQAEMAHGGNAEKLKGEIKHLRDNLKTWARSRKNFNVIVFNRDFLKAFSAGCHAC